MTYIDPQVDQSKEDRYKDALSWNYDEITKEYYLYKPSMGRVYPASFRLDKNSLLILDDLIASLGQIRQEILEILSPCGIIKEKEKDIERGNTEGVITPDSSKGWFIDE